jgi:hypothetical protein
MPPYPDHEGGGRPKRAPEQRLQSPDILNRRQNYSVKENSSYLVIALGGCPRGGGRAGAEALKNVKKFSFRESSMNVHPCFYLWLILRNHLIFFFGVPANVSQLENFMIGHICFRRWTNFSG